MSEQKFKDRSARVILVDPSGPVRQLLTEVVKSIGFANSQAVASIQDAHNIVEAEPVDWLIVPLNADQDLNGLHTVRMVTSFAELQGVKVSLLVEESESWVLAKAFEFGLLSYHLKPFTKDSLSKELNELLQIFESQNWSSAKTSAFYLRKHLRSTNQFPDLLTLEKNLMRIFPGDTGILLNLAEAQHLSGASDASKAIFHQVEMIDPNSAETVKAKRKALFGNEASGESSAAPSGGNILGLGAIVLIDGDDISRAGVKNVLHELGCQDIHEFSDGESAFQWISSNLEPSLVIMEWRIPKLSGPLLIQRIRSKGYINVPLVALSSLIKPVDMPIIREMGVANICQKPMLKEDFLKAIIWTVQQDRMPTEALTMESKIRGFISARRMSDADELITRYLNNPSIASGRKAVIRSEQAFAKEQYELARDLAIDSIKQSGETIFALNILGKSLMTLRQFEQSLKCFQKAQSVSPMNIERLVTIAETQAESGNTDAASETINKAKDLDPDSNVVKEGEAKVELASGNTEAAREIMSQLDSISNVIGYLNNKAVAHAKCGFADEGIKLYEKTLAAVPGQQKETAAVVNYNMALAKIRNGDLPGGLVDLDAVLAVPEARVYKKALNLKQRLVPAVANGQNFQLRESADSAPAAQSLSPEGPSSDESKAADASTMVKALMDLTPGDHCCYLLFKTTANDSPELTKAMTNPPRFKARKTIERGETFKGAEGTKSAS